MMFPRDQIIHCKSYASLCDQDWNRGDTVNGTLIHCDLDSIPEFFDTIRHDKRKFVLVSSCSDWWITEQKKEPAFLDIPKAARIFIKPEHGYTGIQIPGRVSERCRYNDKYSIKCYSYTSCTIPSIPENISHWFTTNKVIDDERVVGIPFGVNNVDMDFKSVDTFSKIQTIGKELLNKVYCNWQFYTGERLDLFALCERNQCCACEYQVPFETYVEHMSSCIATLCPFGNGIDCYRTLEALYCGSVPIITVPHSRGYECYGSYVFDLNNRSIDDRLLDELYGYSAYYNLCAPEKNELLYINYWRDLINNAKNSI